MRVVVFQERFQNNKSYRKIKNDTGISFNTARNWCNKYSDNPDMCKRHHCHDSFFKENQGCPLLISDAQVQEMELIIEAQDDEHPVETKAMTWE